MSNPVEAWKAEVNWAVLVIRPLMEEKDLTPEQAAAWETLETYFSVSLRVMEKSKPKVIRSAALAANISYLLNRLES